MNNQTRITQMTQRLEAELSPSSMHIDDESHLHAGHAGAKSGRGHFRLTISSEKFKALRPLQQHRLIYDALGDLMETEIHALTIKIES
ncbi:MAG: BolA protein [Enterobacterales bacterium]|jgi:BolA protein